ncbi:MAG: NADH-quinone oxidoreductase subunit C [Ignavibacteria bacterium]|nr:NADH-quinone oxidoreductase subunit C [Ignavibacteria bacterium]
MSEIIQQVKEKFSEANGFSGFVFSEINNFPMLELPKERLLEAAKILRDEFKFEQLKDLVSVDRFTKLQRFECIYNLYSLTHITRMFLKVKLDSKKTGSG